MATVSSLLPAPVGEVPGAITNELQKHLTADQKDLDDQGNLKPEADEEAQRKQDGVKRVEAITTVWSKELLIVMFVLLVNNKSYASHVSLDLTSSQALPCQLH